VEKKRKHLPRSAKKEKKKMGNVREAIVGNTEAFGADGRGDKGLHKRRQKA